jgi:hypothetical protein
MNGETEQEWEARFRRTAAEIRKWTAHPDLPDPTYDPDKGWKLDEFAMHFEPNLVREYKNFLKMLHNPELRPRRTVVVDDKHGRQEIIVEDFDSTALLDLKLGTRVRELLLEKRFRVMGVRPGAFEAEVIAMPLLEILRPTIETSELVEMTWPADHARRYELVRVFRLKAGPGVERRYDWPSIARRLKKDGKIYPTDAKLVKFCMENVLLVSGERPDPFPNDKTTREAITKYGLWKFSEQKGEGSGKRRPG